MVPAGTAVKGSWCPAISPYWNCRLTARSSTQSSDLALSAQPLARQFGVCQPDRHHGCLRDGMEPVRHQPRPDPLALCGQLGSRSATSIAGTARGPPIEATLVSGNFRQFLLYRNCERPDKVINLLAGLTALAS